MPLPGLRRSIWDYHRARAAVSPFLRNRPRLANRKQQGLVLDIGCGPNTRPDTINLDYYWRPGVDVCWDATTRLPFPDGYVNGIFTEHFLEHLDLPAALDVLRECVRLLAPGGRIRIVVPDLEIYLRGYHGLGPLPYSDNDQLAGLHTPAMSLNRIMRDHGHRFIYDFATLSALCEMAGLEQVVRCQFGEGGHQDLLLDTAWRAPESLYLEAGKPVSSHSTAVADEHAADVIDLRSVPAPASGQDIG